MRFDDRLATALGQPAESAAARQAVWRQLVDLLGQSPDQGSALRGDALARLRAWRAEVPAASRQNAAILVSQRAVPADLVELFAEDMTAVGAPLLAAAELPDSAWADLIPKLSPVARALLRHRRDLPDGAVRMLQAYGPADLVIPAPVPGAEDGHDIQALRARVEALRAEPRPPIVPTPDAFDFETDPDGVVNWCDLPQRGGLVGLSIAEPAAAGRQGVDGHAAGAFKHRAPFRNARLWIAQGGAAGPWTIAGVPHFDPESGRFAGYRASARRPRAGERADQPGLLGLALTGDSARQFAHEMRTPLNAIAGFAEMIQRQMLGPAAAAYRARADAIVAEAQRIGAVLDELEEAAQLEAKAVAPAAEPVDCALLLARITAALGPAAADKSVLIALAIAPQCAPALIEPAAAERLATRLLSTAIGAAQRGERIDVAVGPSSGLRAETCIAVSRPRATDAMGEDALLNACDLDGAGDEPPLGLGFSLRLVRHAAEACGGRLKLDGPSFQLLLPAAPQRATGAAAAQEAAATTDWTDWLQRHSTAAGLHGETASAIAADPAGPVAQR